MRRKRPVSSAEIQDLEFCPPVSTVGLRMRKAPRPERATHLGHVRVIFARAAGVLYSTSDVRPCSRMFHRP
jgi:hypothetical protein